VDEIGVGGENGSRVTIRIVDRENPSSSDFWDGNWLIVHLDVAVDGFHGGVDGALRIEELAAFRAAVMQVLVALRAGDKAIYETMEHWLRIELTVGNLGHIRVEGEVAGPLRDCRLVFDFSSDQSYIQDTLAGLDQVLARYPIRGSR
jgi:hypothetical protein